MEQINTLESQLSEAKAARDKEEKDFKYRLSEIAQEMKSQKTRLDREAEKAKVSSEELGWRSFIGSESDFSISIALKQDLKIDRLINFL